MPEPKIRTQSTFPATLTIDGVALDVHVKRMGNTEFDAFTENFDRWSAPRGPEETPDARKERERTSAAWLRDALNTYLAIVPGEFEHDGRAITQGGDLIDIYGGRDDIVPQAIAIVWAENRLSDAQKKTYRLRLASRFGSTTEPQPTANGNAADSTAPDVDGMASTSDGAATAPPSDASSGTTDPSA